MANFSERQYLELLNATDVSDEVKQYISARVKELFAEYEALPDASGTDPAIRWLVEHEAGPTPATPLRNGVLSPSYAFSRYLNDLKDMVTAG